jgi:hypothetical protein
MKKVPLSIEEVRVLILRYEPWQPILIGPLCVQLGPRGFEEVEKMLGLLVEEGLIRPLTDAELVRHDFQVGFKLVSKVKAK